jgi:DNA helicase-2/ATP-dependent DNA helicase PcrA
MMTVHSSKGLEFDAVFITGLEEGLFPHENSQSDAGGIEEERRLMYVAITRARKRLYLTHSQTRFLHGQTRYGIKSRFFDELPEQCLRWLSPKNQGFQDIPSYKAYTDWSAGKSAPQDLSSMASSLQPKAADVQGLQKGMKVFHTKFGEGVVLSLEGIGLDARAQINFSRHGVKWLALSVAKLTVI